ncbi:MAG: DNA mismatch repair protein MutS [Betaproteobacteria bacterium TMED82]|nr:MAG: DNA mismatch repair protein MutS [Betaproteobacteria bacterium TMED82]|tara:strand:+ start:55799 stop:58453 length:2655 start_codon:yes stop_codon:yes gene_type:complete
MTSDVNHTPVIKQYLNIKKDYPNSLVFFRMGDFYELFFEDAKEASKLLSLTLTTRGQSAGKPVDLAGVPVHSSSNYIKRLLEAGRTIAICEQIGSIDNTKGIFQRKVTRIITAGTLYDEELLTDLTQTFVGAFDAEGGFIWCEVASGELLYEEIDMNVPSNESLDKLEAIFSKYNIVEVILQESNSELNLKSRSNCSNFLKNVNGSLPQRYYDFFGQKGRLVGRPPWDFDEKCGEKTLKQRLNLSSLHAINLHDKKSLLRATNALFSYIDNNIGQKLSHIRLPKEGFQKDFLEIDPISQNSLELINPIFKSSKNVTLFECLNKCKTKAGARKLKSWILFPLKSNSEVELRQKSVGWLSQKPRISLLLSGLNDFSRASTRLSLKKTNPRELVGLTVNICNLREIGNILIKSNEPLLLKISKIFLDNKVDEFESYINKCLAKNSTVKIKEGNIIKDGFDALLDELREKQNNLLEELVELEKKEKINTNISNLKIKFNAVHGYFIEVPASQKTRVPKTYIRKQTLKNAERYITPNLKVIESQFLHNREQTLEKEAEIYHSLILKLKPFADILFSISEAISELDVLHAFGKKLIVSNWHFPGLSETTEIQIAKGKHPALEELRINSSDFSDIYPNDTYLDKNASTMIITGPNMSGKSTYMRQVALITILGRIGCPVPAENCRLGLIDKIFTRIGTADDLEGGRSTFMVEMTETAKILKCATKKSLVLIDEIGRGTSTSDGLSLAWAIAFELTQVNRSLTLFSTHYLELTKLAKKLTSAINFYIKTIEEANEIIFLYQLVEGVSHDSYGIKVAELAGLPTTVIQMASKMKKSVGKASEYSGSGDKKLKATEDHLYKNILAELRTLNLDKTTPLDAMKWIARWQENLSLK